MTLHLFQRKISQRAETFTKVIEAKQKPKEKGRSTNATYPWQKHFMETQMIKQAEKCQASEKGKNAECSCICAWQKQFTHGKNTRMERCANTNIFPLPLLTLYSFLAKENPSSSKEENRTKRTTKSLINNAISIYGKKNPYQAKKKIGYRKQQKA